LTRALASELGEKNVRVNVMVPGYVETDMTEGTKNFLAFTIDDLLFGLGFQSNLPSVTPDLI